MKRLRLAVGSAAPHQRAGLHRRIVTGGVGLAAVVSAIVLAPLSEPRSASAQVRDGVPNVIVILADDLGYADTAAYGSKLVHTPNIDALAASGVRFTAGYATHPVCAPSRSGLLTGRYQERFGYEFNPVGRDRDGGLSLNEIMLPQVMKAAGYATGMVGKWHLGQAGNYHPNQRGFDFYFGMVGGGSGYIIVPVPGDDFSDAFAEDGAAGRGRSGMTLAQALERRRAQAPISRNGVVVREADYLTEAFTREGLNYIDQNRDKPFFLYMAYNAPHAPLEVTKKYLDRYPNVADKTLRIRTAMISALDDGVGTLMAKLKSTGLDRNTIVFFLSDNGCPRPAAVALGACSNDPLVGFKRTHFEGGVRVPFIVSWPGHVPAGRVDNRTVSSLDILPTAVAAARGKLPADRDYDGVDLMPFLTGARAGTPNPVLYWRAGPNFAIRDGDWKMILTDKAPPGATAGTDVDTPDDKTDPSTYNSQFGQHTMLYDLKASATETRNLAPAQSSTVTRLKAKIVAWNKLLGAPQWSSRRQSYEQYDGTVVHLYD